MMFQLLSNFSSISPVKSGDWNRREQPPIPLNRARSQNKHGDSLTGCHRLSAAIE
jgi:hypothetical protein